MPWHFLAKNGALPEEKLILPPKKAIVLVVTVVAGQTSEWTILLNDNLNKHVMRNM